LRRSPQALTLSNSNSYAEGFKLLSLLRFVQSKICGRLCVGCVPSVASSCRQCRICCPVTTSSR
jgi:hypothetical protein